MFGSKFLTSDSNQLIMTPFLRKIRRSLLSENKFSRYLLYAIGEILLVVIGILIALQINDWSEEEKLKKYELKMLRELSNTLKKDQSYFSSLVERLDQKGKAVDKLLEFRLTGQENLDSVGKYFQVTRFETLFQYNSGPYGSIKSSGIEKISNDSIRAKMVDLYEFLLPRTEKIMEKLDGSDAKEEELMESLTQRTLVIRNGNQTIQRIIADPKVMYQADFLQFIQVHKSNTFVAKSRIQAILPSISALDTLIQQELTKK
jgi:hypothetical protein